MSKGYKDFLLRVSELLKEKLTDTTEVLYQDGMIKIKIPCDQLEKRMGALLKNIQCLIDESFLKGITTSRF